MCELDAIEEGPRLSKKALLLTEPPKPVTPLLGKAILVYFKSCRSAAGRMSIAFFVWLQDLEQRGDSGGFKANAIKKMGRMCIILVFRAKIVNNKNQRTELTIVTSSLVVAMSSASGSLKTGTLLKGPPGGCLFIVIVEGGHIVRVRKSTHIPCSRSVNDRPLDRPTHTAVGNWLFFSEVKMRGENFY